MKNTCVSGNQTLPKFTGETLNFFKFSGKNIQVSPVTTRRLGSTNLIRDIRGTRTNEFRKKSKKKKKKKKKKFFFLFFFYFGSQGRN